MAEQEQKSLRLKVAGAQERDVGKGTARRLQHGKTPHAAV